MTWYRSGFLDFQEAWIIPIGSTLLFKSGIGSCIAPKAGIALPPAKGKSCHLRIPIGPTGSGVQGETGAPDQGVTKGNLGYPTGKQRGRESKHNIPFHSIGGEAPTELGLLNKNDQKKR